MNQDLIQDINKISKRLIITDIFYGLFLSTIEKKECKDIPLAAVGVNKSTMEFSLLINPDEWFKYSPEVRFGVLKHEACHLTQFHLLTADMYLNAELDNIACDIEVNQYIDKQFLPSWCCFLDDFKKKYPQLDLKPNAGRAHYYKELNKLPEEEKKKMGASLEENARHKWVIVDGDGKPVDNLTESEKDALRVQIETVMENITEEMKSSGAIPAEINQVVSGFVKPKPKFDYLKYIRNYVGNSDKYIIGRSKLKENQRFPDQGKVVLKPISKILVLVDESGSVSQTELYQFLNEIHHLSKKSSIEIRPFDTEVMEPVKYSGSGSFKRTNCGGKLVPPYTVMYKEIKM